MLQFVSITKTFPPSQILKAKKKKSPTAVGRVGNSFQLSRSLVFHRELFRKSLMELVPCEEVPNPS